MRRPKRGEVGARKAPLDETVIVHDMYRVHTVLDETIDVRPEKKSAHFSGPERAQVDVTRWSSRSASRNIGQPEVGFPAGDCTITGEMTVVAMDLSDDREASEGG